MPAPKSAGFFSSGRLLTNRSFSQIKAFLFFLVCAIIDLVIWRRIEVVITSLTRNQVVGQPARGFESHRLRLLKTPGAFAGPGVFLISSIPLSHREISHAHRPPQNQSQVLRPISLPGSSHRNHKSPDIPHVQNHRR